MRGGHPVGLVANPASARDIRRLVAHGAAVTTNHKINVVKRVLAGRASTGVDRVLSMTDLGGISGGLAQLSRGPAANGWPQLDFVELPLTKTSQDTTTAVEAMVARSVTAIVVLGGDGTNRIVAGSCGDTPIASISTGTNNTFPGSDEPTVVGMAAGLIATGAVPVESGTTRTKVLDVLHGERREQALVDVAITDHDAVASGSLWDPTRIHELFLSFAEPDAIGLSSIGAHVRPVERDAPTGLHLRLGRPAAMQVRAPIGPGLIVAVDIAAAEDLLPGRTVEASSRSGVVAIDGERAFRLDPAEPVSITLDHTGPLAIDVARTMRFASRSGVLARQPVTARSPSTHTETINEKGARP
jgi:predicted polyphosphate/ATP-dependent NAD kinase